MSISGTLALVFGRIGPGAFGGGLATIPFIHFEIVLSRGWLSEREFAEVVSIAQMTPGPMPVNAATFVGYKISGITGAFVSTLSVVGAPLLLLVTVLYIISKASGIWKKRVARLQSVLRPVVSGMLIVAFLVVIRPLTFDWCLWAITAGLFLFSVLPLLKRYPRLLILFAGVAGIVLLSLDKCCRCVFVGSRCK